MVNSIVEFPRFAIYGLPTKFNLHNDKECQKLLDIISTSFYRFINWQGKLNKSMPSMPDKCICGKLIKCKCLQRYTKNIILWLDSRAKTEDGCKYSTYSREQRNSRCNSSSSSSSSTS